MTLRSNAFRRFGVAFVACSGIALTAAAQSRDQRPDGPPPTPPPEAFTACEQKSEGAACTVQFDGHTINGTCSQWQDQKLFCRPERPPGPPPRR
jgi:hypothetical protein